MTFKDLNLNKEDLSELKKNINEIGIMKKDKRNGESPKILYHHQLLAVKKWFANGMKGIFSMATGTGKTIAALECLRILLNNYKPLCSVIACPNNQLIVQWKSEIIKYSIDDEIIIADSTNRKWKDKITECLIDLQLENKKTVIILTTHDSLTSNTFNTIFKDNYTSKINYLLIGDEVHRLGSSKRRLMLFDGFNFRLGLSATPDRGIFDIEGSETIIDFFHDVIYKFDLGDAITQINPTTGKSYLTPFYYKPLFVELEKDEVDEYIDLTYKISRLYTKTDNEKNFTKNEDVKNLLFQRSNIIKNARNKLNYLEQIIHNLQAEYEELKWLLIYCTEKQIDAIFPIMKKHGLISHKFTMKEGTKPSVKYQGLSERSYLLKRFEEGDYNALVAMKCLDEGVDIPPARFTILTASSCNEREYIQRIGRVIRRYPGKKFAIIYDLVVYCPIEKLPKQIKNVERKIMKSEYERYEKIVKNAINGSEALSDLYKLKKKLMSV